MTLILATITRQCAVLAVDCRVIGTSKKTGERLLLSDTEQKIAAYADVAVAHQGAQSVDGQSVTLVTQAWLEQHYSAEADFQDQISALSAYLEERAPGVGLVAIHRNAAVTELLRLVEEPEYKVLRPQDTARMTISGTGSHLVQSLLEASHIKLGDLGPLRLAKFSAWLINAVHNLLTVEHGGLISVGPDVSVVMLAESGIKYTVIKPSELDLELEKPVG